MDKAMDPVRAQGAVNQILEYLAVRIASGEKIEIRRFGSFSIRLRAARVARNPRTGEILNLSAVKVCYFKPGKVLLFVSDIQNIISIKRSLPLFVIKLSVIRDY